MNNFNVDNYIEITELKSLNVNKQNFNRITTIVKNTFRKLGINLENASIYYQRNKNLTSVLSIKVSQGDDNDVNNYMFNKCSVNYNQDELFYDISLHAKAKSKQNSIYIANLITKDIIEFFKKIEQELFQNNQSDLELSLKIPFEQKKTKILLKKL